MTLLALEFSCDQRSVALVHARAGVGAISSFELVETGGRSTRALSMIEEVLCQAKLEREQVECVAVGLGPGSYTGIRTAIALAQGWQLARDVRLLGISSADCVAAQAYAEGLAGRVAVVIDAQRGEFYLGNYELNPAGWRKVAPLRLATLADLRACRAAGDILAGPEVNKWFTEGRVVFPRAARLGQLASARTDFVSGEKLEPIYLRETAFVKAPRAHPLPPCP